MEGSMNFLNSLISWKRKFLSALGQVTRRGLRSLPPIVSVVGLGIVGVVAASPVAISAIAATQSEATDIDLLLLLSATSLVAMITLLVSYLMRMAGLEEKVESTAEQARRLVAYTQSFQRDQTDGQVFPDNWQLWSKLVGDTILINPSLKHESWIAYRANNMCIWQVDEQRCRNILRRATSQYIMPNGAITSLAGDPNIIQIQRKAHDPRKALHLAVVLDKAKRDSGLNLEAVNVHFSDSETPDQRSAFISSVTFNGHEPERAVLIYGNGYAGPEQDDIHRIDRGVVMYRSKDAIQGWEAEAQRLLKWGISVTGSQLVEAFREFLPKYDGELVPMLPDDFTFDPATLAVERTEGEVFEQGDGSIYIREGRPKKRKSGFRNKVPRNNRKKSRNRKPDDD